MAHIDENESTAPSLTRQRMNWLEIHVGHGILAITQAGDKRHGHGPTSYWIMLGNSCEPHCDPALNRINNSAMKMQVRSFVVAIASFLTLRADAQNNGVVYQIPASEYSALVDLYNNTGGAGWVNSSGWLDPNATSWAGVDIGGVQYDANGNVTVQGHVQELYLDFNQLSGSIPASLGNLTQLQALNLQDNQLSGSIPASLGNLTQLQALNLLDNQLSGSIPDSLGNLTQLQVLYLDGNQLSGSIPASLGNLTQLSGLELVDNQLSGSIPDSLGNLTQLVWLLLYDNQLSGSIPDSLGNLTQLVWLELYDNQLVGDVPIFSGPLGAGASANDYYAGAYLDNNCLEISPGTQSRANIDLMISMGKNIVYSPQSADCSEPIVTGQISCTCDSNAIAGASVQIGTYSGISGVDGSYSISNVPPETYTAIVSASNFFTLTNSVTIPLGVSVVTNNFALTPVSALDYFGVGVNWSKTTTPPYYPNGTNLLGNVDASNLDDALAVDVPTYGYGVVVPLDATQSGTLNGNTIVSSFNQFATNVGTNDTVLFYFATHALQIADPNQDLGLDISDASMTFSGLNIAGLLKQLPSSTRKIVVVDSCEAGAIAGGLAGVSNLSILAACSSTNNASSAPDGSGVFTDALIDELDSGIFDLSKIISDINNDTLGTYASLIGQDLYLRNTGSATFTGLQPQFYEGAGFTGSLLGPTPTGLQPAPTVSAATMSNGFFQLSLTNVPTQGDIALECSTDLVMWLQIAFDPAAGTNLAYSLAVTNQSSGFFRAKVAQ
jgi:hypothetical protein